MDKKQQIKKVADWRLWAHLLAMVMVVLLLCLGVKFGLDIYTRHGEEVEVPDIVNMDYDKAMMLLDEYGLKISVADSGYNKKLPADCILAQAPSATVRVKAGRVIYVTVNSTSSPTVTIPDIIDNSSLREAEAKLAAMGFKMLPPKRIVGEKDWVYGIISRGRRVGTGDRVTTDAPRTLIVGSGGYEDENVSFSDDYGDEPVDAGSAVIEEEIVVPELDGVMGTSEIEKE